MTKPFDRNDRAAIQAALDHPEGNPIAEAISLRVERLHKALRNASAGDIGLPDQITLPKPATAFEEAVLAVFVASLDRLPKVPSVTIRDDMVH